MLMFVTYMYTKSYRSQTIRSYLSSVRSIHMEEGYSNPSEQSYCIKQALKAIQRSEDKPMKKFPITYEILRKWQSLMSDMLNNVLWKAAFSLAHFALLRASEFTVPAQSQFSPDKNLVNEDVQFHSTEQGYKYIAVHLKQSKTDKNNSGYYIYIGCTGTDVCAYCSMYEFIQSKSHNNDKAPLFQFTNGVILSKTCLVQTIKLFAVRSGIDPSKYSGHIFRIGGCHYNGLCRYGGLDDGPVMLTSAIFGHQCLCLYILPVAWPRIAIVIKIVITATLMSQICLNSVVSLGRRVTQLSTHV